MKLKYFNSASADEKPCFDISEDLGGGNFGYIGEVFEEANAAFIVRAVNNHDKLLHALDRIRRTGFNGTEEEAPHKIAAEAIKQAEAE